MIITSKVTPLLTDGVNNIDGFLNKSYRLKLEIDVSGANGLNGVQLFKEGNFYTSISYDSDNGVVVFDRSNSGTIYSGVRYAKVDPIDNKIKLDIFVDVNSIEVFINDGYYTMSGNVYPSDSSHGLAFELNGGKLSNVSYSLFEKNN